MDFADYPGLNGELAADFHARHFMRRDTHVYDPSQMPHLPPYNAAALAGLAVDVKPRLTKEQHDVLESEFQKQSKPNTNTKKRFADVLGVSLDKVNVRGHLLLMCFIPLFPSFPLSDAAHRTGFRTAEQSPSKMPKSRPEHSICCNINSPTSRR